jgi:hypothetical protein
VNEPKLTKREKELLQNQQEVLSQLTSYELDQRIIQAAKKKVKLAIGSERVCLNKVSEAAQAFRKGTPFGQCVNMVVDDTLYWEQPL